MSDDSFDTASNLMCDGRSRWPGVALLCLMLATPLGPAFAVGEVALSADASPDQTELSEEEEDDRAGDGSELLSGSEYLVVPAELRPVGLAEEEALLGDWGDSAAEDED